MTAPSGRFWEKSYPAGIKADFEPPSSNLQEMFQQLVADHGSRVAIDYNDHEITYEELGRQAARICHGLKRNGVKPGDRIAIYLPNTPYHPFFFFGVLLASARVVHLSPLDAERELKYKCNDSGAQFLITLDSRPFSTMAQHLLDDGSVGRIILCDDSAYGASEEPATTEIENAITYVELTEGLSDKIVFEPVKHNDVALLQYSGGTTGKPKAVMLTHANMVSAVAMYEYWFTAFTQDIDIVELCIAPLFHIMALTTSLLWVLKDGSRLVLRQKFNVDQVLDDIEQKKVTGFMGVPTMWIALTNHPEIRNRDLSSLKHIGSGGAPLPPEVFANVEHLTGLRLGGGWGMTETAPAGSSLPPAPPNEKIHSIGLPLPGLDIEIVAVDNPRKKLPLGETGEIRIKGPNVTPGYWNRPEETEGAFVDGWLMTGDIASMDEDGYLYLVDRKKDLILSGGFNVYPQVIEEAIYEHPDVAATVVIGIPDEYRGEAAKAFIILKKNASPFTLDALRNFLSDKIGKHELPQQLEFRSELPLTSVGKYSRKDLREEHNKSPG